MGDGAALIGSGKCIKQANSALSRLSDGRGIAPFGRFGRLAGRCTV